jgi:hypothetical protein
MATAGSAHQLHDQQPVDHVVPVIGNGATVRNLNLANVNITATASSTLIGALAGENRDLGRYDRSSVSSELTRARRLPGGPKGGLPTIRRDCLAVSGLKAGRGQVSCSVEHAAPKCT